MRRLIIIQVATTHPSNTNKRLGSHRGSRLIRGRRIPISTDEQISLFGIRHNDQEDLLATLLSSDHAKESRPLHRAPSNPESAPLAGEDAPLCLVEHKETWRSIQSLPGIEYFLLVSLTVEQRQHNPARFRS